MRNQTGRNGCANQSLEVRGDLAHLLLQVSRSGLAVLSLLDHGLGESRNDFEISGGDVETHGDLGSVNDGLCLLAILTKDGGQIVQPIIGQGLLVTNGEHQFGVSQVVRDNFDQLGKVPAVPFSDTHEELVDALVLEVDGGAGLDDVVVVLGDTELDLGSRVRVAHAQTGLFNIARLQVLQEFVSVEAKTTNNITDNVGGIGGFA